MEAFVAGKSFSNDVVIDFPDNLAPFPDTSDGLYSDRTVHIQPPEIDHRSFPPLQKLRPIRCQGRNLEEYSDFNGGLEGSLLSCDGVVPSHELGFVTQLSSQNRSLLNDGGVEEYDSDAPPADAIGNGVAVAEDGCLVAIRKIKTEVNAECANIISQARMLEAELSSSSEDDCESSVAFKVHFHRKRKRKRARIKLELILENMMKEVIQRQEKMHKQLLDMIEKKEQERLIREEAWKQKEMKRAKREEELRAQETSRSLALISYIQSILGQEFPIPKAFDSIPMDNDEGEIHNQEAFISDPNNRRWPKSEVQALITLRSAMDQKILRTQKGGSVWEEVASGLSNMGYNRTPKKCKEKWENINKYYKKTMENGKKRPDNGKSCPYFHELDVLYRNGVLFPGNPPSYMKRENERD